MVLQLTENLKFQAYMYINKLLIIRFVTQHEFAMQRGLK